MSKQLTKFDQKLSENIARTIIQSGGVRLLTLHTDVKPTSVTGNKVFLIDVSGSTLSSVGKLTVHQHIKNAIDEFPEVRRVSFSSGVYMDEVQRPHGGTDMEAAFKHLRGQHHDGVILVSDGLPDDPDGAVREAVALGVRVDVIFIGDMDKESGRQGEKFMQRLASATGGEQFTSDKRGMQLLSTTLAGHIRGLLGTGSGPILL